MPMHARLTVLASGLAVALAACGSDSGPTESDGKLMPDFTLLDVNPSSASFDAGVSPRDFLGDVSAWYFGHST